jgi:hypothetical protein
MVATFTRDNFRKDWRTMQDAISYAKQNKNVSSISHWLPTKELVVVYRHKPNWFARIFLRTTDTWTMDSF